MKKTPHNQLAFIANKTIPPHLRAQLLNDAAAMNVDPIDVLLQCYAADIDRRGLAPKVEGDPA